MSDDDIIERAVDYCRDQQGRVMVLPGDADIIREAVREAMRSARETQRQQQATQEES